MTAMGQYPYHGGCLCGRIRFEILGPIRSIVHCHCSMCRKAQGGAFATNGFVSAGEFRFVSGDDMLADYESSPGKRKYFCRHCGSPILSTSDKNPEKLRVRLGTIESDIEERPSAHIFVTSGANWDRITDELPRYESYEPGR